jgi:predicted enzyme related to lactoylglutathione lyase
MFKPKVIVFGGIFFKAKKPSRLRKWYRDHLSFNLNPYGSSFEFRNANNPDKVQYFLWSVFKNDTDYFSPSTKEFMVNFRVENIEKTVAYLRKIGTEIIYEVTTYPYGKFVHILDPEGNAIELWEANDDFFSDLMGPTNK